VALAAEAQYVDMADRMIQQRVGDLLEIEFEGRWYYIVVLTKIVMFGGNIIFAFHSEGAKRPLAALLDAPRGFNICTDLLMLKRDGGVRRMHHVQDTSHLWLTKYVKSCNVVASGVKATTWFIYRIDDLAGPHVDRVRSLTPEYGAAMDDGCYVTPPREASFRRLRFAGIRASGAAS
jgi:hypothetical protein